MTGRIRRQRRVRCRIRMSGGPQRPFLINHLVPMRSESESDCKKLRALCAALEPLPRLFIKDALCAHSGPEHSRGRARE